MVGLDIWRETKIKKGDISLGFGGKGRSDYQYIYKIKNETLLLHVKVYKAPKMHCYLKDRCVVKYIILHTMLKKTYMASKKTKPLFYFLSQAK